MHGCAHTSSGKVGYSKTETLYRIKTKISGTQCTWYSSNEVSLKCFPPVIFGFSAIGGICIIFSANKEG